MKTQGREGITETRIVLELEEDNFLVRREGVNVSKLDRKYREVSLMR